MFIYEEQLFIVHLSVFQLVPPQMPPLIRPVDVMSPYVTQFSIFKPVVVLMNPHIPPVFSPEALMEPRNTQSYTPYSQPAFFSLSPIIPPTLAVPVTLQLNAAQFLTVSPPVVPANMPIHSPPLMLQSMARQFSIVPPLFYLPSCLKLIQDIQPSCRTLCRSYVR